MDSKSFVTQKKTDEENLGHDLTQKNLGDKAFYKTRKEKVQNHLKFVFYNAELPPPPKSAHTMQSILFWSKKSQFDRNSS